MKTKEKRKKLQRRAYRVRAKLRGKEIHSRLSVFRSAKHIFAQLIDDKKGVTLVAFSDTNLNSKTERKEGEDKAKEYSGKQRVAFLVGYNLALKALKIGEKKVCFDRGGRLYHGRVRALAEGARAGGLQF